MLILLIILLFVNIVVLVLVVCIFRSIRKSHISLAVRLYNILSMVSRESPGC